MTEPFFALEPDDEALPLPWQVEALCAQTDPEAFFPEKGGSTREAKRVCGRCDVRGECLSYALAHDERFGIWGGLSERERRRLASRARRSASRPSTSFFSFSGSTKNGTMCSFRSKSAR